MTNKIASEVLKASSIQQMSFCKVIVDGKSFSVKEALDTAIEALEQEPCEDCISRQAVLEVLKKNRYRFNISQEGYCEGKVLWSENLIKDDACKEIKQLPSVTPKEKTGHWIDTDEWRETVDGFEQWGYFRKCSKCGYVFKFLEIDNYCPNCGRHMVEPQESEGVENESARS